MVDDVLSSYRTWAIVGLSSSPLRASFDVAQVLQRAGYTIVPVNPNEREVLGRRAYPTLAAAAAEHRIEVVDVFRRSEHVAALVEEAMAVSAKALWLQLGVRDPEAEERARAAGLQVVVDRCPKIELARAGGRGPYPQALQG